MGNTISADEAKNRLDDWIARVDDDDTEVIIERHGKPKAVIMPFEAYRSGQGAARKGATR